VTNEGGTITARLFAGLEMRTRQGRPEQSVLAAEAPSVVALMGSLGLEAESVGLVLVNGVHVSVDQDLADGDVVSLFPPLGGG
jgi:sulfur carrier protein